MALDYFLYLNTAKPVLEVVRSFALIGGYRQNGRKDVTELEKEGVTVIGIEAHPVTRDLIRDEFGFSPTVVVMFTINEEMADTAIDVMIADVAAFLAREPGDAVLVMSGDHTVLARQGGRVMLNEDFHNYWTAERRARFPLPHALAALPMF